MSSANKAQGMALDSDSGPILEDNSDFVVSNESGESSSSAREADGEGQEDLDQELEC